MDIINLSVILKSEQIKNAKLVLQSTRYFKYHVVELHGIQFQASWWSENNYSYSAAHWKIELEDFRVIEKLKQLGFSVNYAIPAGYRESPTSLQRFKFPMTDWIEAVQYFDEYYQYSDSAEVYRNHSQKEDLIKSRAPTLEEALFIKHVLPVDKHTYIPKHLLEQVNAVAEVDLWQDIELNESVDLKQLIDLNKTDFSHLTKPCRFNEHDY